MKITDFYVIRVPSAEGLAQTVKVMAANGWELHGHMHHSVSWAISPNGRPNGHVMSELFVQAMVKHE